MANKDAPFGFKLVGKIGSSVQNNGTTEYEIASGASGSIFSGDPVRMTAGTILVCDLRVSNQYWEFLGVVNLLILTEVLCLKHTIHQDKHLQVQLLL